MPNELIPIVAIICLIGLPMFGVVVRYAFRPLIQDLAKAIRGASEDELNAIHERLAILEERLDQQEETVRRISDADRFQRELEGSG